MVGPKRKRVWREKEEGTVCEAENELGIGNCESKLKIWGSDAVRLVVAC